jgi:hypothetical protein
VTVYLIVGSLVSSVLFLPLRGIFPYYSLSAGVCYWAGVWMDTAVELLNSVRVKKNSCCEVV